VATILEIFSPLSREMSLTLFTRFSGRLTVNLCNRLPPRALRMIFHTFKHWPPTHSHARTTRTSSTHPGARPSSQQLRSQCPNSSRVPTWRDARSGSFKSPGLDSRKRRELQPRGLHINRDCEEAWNHPCLCPQYPPYDVH
jgi:hypothetical protein